MKSYLTLLLAAMVSAAMAQKEQNGTFNLDETYKMSPSGTIKLNASDAQVTVAGSGRNTAHVKIQREVTTRGVTFGREEFTVEVEERNGNLEIQERTSSANVSIIGYYYERYTIDIEAPNGASLIIDGDDGDYMVRNVNGDISISVDDGDVELFGCKGNRFSFQLDDGDLSMDEGAGQLDIGADDADVRISGGRFTGLVADLDDGDLVLETTLADGGEYSITAEDGLVDLTILEGDALFDIYHDDGRTTADSAFKMIEQSDDYTKVRLGKGTMRFDIHADDAYVRLAAK